MRLDDRQRHMGRWLATSAAILAALTTVSCDGTKGKSEPSFVQLDYAKDPGGKCTKRDRAFYDEKAKSAEGIKELVMISCQNNVRANYHTSEASKNKADFSPESASAKAMDCLQEQVTLLESLRQVGVTSTSCPTK